VEVLVKELQGRVAVKLADGRRGSRSGSWRK
jgi:hypothetical protein